MTKIDDGINYRVVMAIERINKDIAELEERRNSIITRYMERHGIDYPEFEKRFNSYR